jgi:hypothetical protein
VLLCVLVDVLLAVFQSTWVLFARKNGGLVLLKNVLQFDAIAAYIQQSTRIGSSDGIYS